MTIKITMPQTINQNSHVLRPRIFESDDDGAAVVGVTGEEPDAGEGEADEGVGEEGVGEEPGGLEGVGTPGLGVEEHAGCGHERFGVVAVDDKVHAELQAKHCCRQQLAVPLPRFVDPEIVTVLERHSRTAPELEAAVFPLNVTSFTLAVDMLEKRYKAPPEPTGDEAELLLNCTADKARENQPFA